MSYPDAFCVRCQSHVSPHDKHTVILKNKSRALTGQCPNCGSDVYRLMPKKVIKSSPAVQDLRRQFPDGFCLHCKTMRPIDGHEIVVLQNDSFALRGECRVCEHQVYRILGNQYPESQGTPSKTKVPLSAKPAALSQPTAAAVPTQVSSATEIRKSMKWLRETKPSGQRAQAPVAVAENRKPTEISIQQSRGTLDRRQRLADKPLNINVFVLDRKQPNAAFSQHRSPKVSTLMFALGLVGLLAGFIFLRSNGY